MKGQVNSETQLHTVIIVTQNPHLSFYTFFGRQLGLLQFAVDKIFENDG